MMYQPDGERYLVFASDSGSDRNPAWYWNLTAHPQATVDVGDQLLSVVAAEMKGAERDAKYSLQAEQHPQFAGYQAKRHASIPVIALTPNAPPS
jgi:deazaflavin-dependent oxidoreductase (nitroreductase family)